MLHGYKKKRYQLFDNLDYLGFNLYEQRHFCFGGEAEGPGGEDSVDEGAPTSPAAQDEENENVGRGFAEDYLSSIQNAVEEAEAEAAAVAAAQFDTAMRSVGLNPEDPLGPNTPAPSAPFDGFHGPPMDEDYTGVAKAAANSIAGLNAAVQAGWAEMAGGQTDEQKDEEQESFEQAMRAAAMEQTEEQRAVMQLLGPRTEEEKADEEKSFNSLMSTWAGANDLLSTLNIMDRRGVVAHSREQGVDLEEMSRERAQDMMTAYRSMKPQQQAFYATTIHNMANRDSFGPDEYIDIPFMNFMRDELGLPSYASGYRGKYEARTGPTNVMLTEAQYDPSTITGADPSSQSGVNLSMFNQFAIDNPTMTVEQAMEAYNNEMGPNSVNQVSAAELGMLGYAPNAPAGRAAQDNENERERGVQQGLSLLASFAVSPTSLFSNIFGSHESTGMGRGLNEIASALGLDFPVGMVMDQFGMPAGVQDFYDSLPDMPSFDMPSFDMPSITGFGGLLGDPKSPGPDDVDLDSPQSFFDTMATDMTTAEVAAAIADIMEEDPEIDDQPLRAGTPFQTASIPEEDDSGFIPFRERFPELNRPPAWKKRYQELAALYGPKKAKEMMKQEERFV
jgi:hypothetical protein